MYISYSKTSLQRFGDAKNKIKLNTKEGSFVLLSKLRLNNHIQVTTTKKTSNFIELHNTYSGVTISKKKLYRNTTVEKLLNRLDKKVYCEGPKHVLRNDFDNDFEEEMETSNQSNTEYDSDEDPDHEQPEKTLKNGTIWVRLNDGKETSLRKKINF
ncbi:hypothetical protein BpHYR1_031271 [Brachionus plicatilis]|uniref:Uncharacterized protein n=1 Tax=Brachionus plicatilis TaxID=10195 RepID=A0A3M7R7P7_BRAPC|nr:hypothetical protein BpHYR1_031271 [Brachionus plicatilis]